MGNKPQWVKIPHSFDMSSTAPKKNSRGSTFVALGLFFGALVPGTINSCFALSGAAKGLESLVILASWIIFCVGLGLIARGKGHSILWGISGLVFWIGGIVVLFLPRRNSPSPNLPSAEV